MNIHLTFDESLKDVFSALCKDIQKRLGRGKEEGGRNLKERSSRLKLKSQYFSKGVPLKKSLYISKNIFMN